MRAISRSNAFKRDYRREMRGQYRETLEADLRNILDVLAADELLRESYQDHPMIGRWNRYRNCHVRPDLILLYRKPDPETLELARLGSHSELSL